MPLADTHRHRRELAAYNERERAVARNFFSHAIPAGVFELPNLSTFIFSGDTYPIYKCDWQAPRLRYVRIETFTLRFILDRMPKHLTARPGDITSLPYTFLRVRRLGILGSVL